MDQTIVDKFLVDHMIQIGLNRIDNGYFDVRRIRICVCDLFDASILGLLW